MRIVSLIAACAALAWQISASAQAPQSNVERHTRFGPVVGIDGSATSGTYAWKGIPFAKPPTGALRWKAPVDPDRWKTSRTAQAFGNACVQYGRIYGPGAQQHPRLHHRHDAESGGGQRRLPVPEHLAPRRPPWQSAGDCFCARRQQRLGLHGRPGLRRCRTGQGRGCGGRHGQLPSGHLWLLQHAAAQVGKRLAGRLGQLCVAGHHQSAGVRAARHREVSAAIPPTSR